MSLHINRFVDRIKAFESRGQRDFVMTMAEARDLHGDITKLLLVVQALREVKDSHSNNDQVIEITMDGGSF